MSDNATGMGIEVEPDEGFDDAAQYESDRIDRDDEFEQYEEVMEDQEEKSDGGLDADSTGMKTSASWHDDKWQDGQNRERALNLSAASVGVTADPHAILTAAQEFYKFLQGNDYEPAKLPAGVGITYPHNDEAGNTILAEGVLLSANLEVVIVGKRVYRYAETYEG